MCKCRFKEYLLSDTDLYFAWFVSHKTIYIALAMKG